MDSSTPQARSAETPLILAAIELFGAEGYAAVSTRALCSHAGTNLSSIKYHFGGKDELYRAAVVYVIDQIRPRIELALSAFEQGKVLAGNDRTRQALLIRQLVGNLLEFFLGSEDIPHFMPFVMREFFMPGKYFPLFYEAVPRHLHQLFSQIVAMAGDGDPDDEATIIRAHSIIGQIMMFHIGRPILFARMGWEEFNPVRIELITQQTQTLVLRALGLEDAAQEQHHEG
jgi:AcrR family transcriptional regulator